MNAIVILPCHNQEEIVKINIARMKIQSWVPQILVLNDHSDTFNIPNDEVVTTFDTAKFNVSGRSATRNLGIDLALDKGADVLIFMDGDTIPRMDDYIENYMNLFARLGPRVIFGMRSHIPRPINFRNFNDGLDYKAEPLTLPPSDMLTANMDNLYNNKPMSNIDLRITGNMVNYFKDAETLEQKLSYVLSGWVTWSCNFAINRCGIEKIGRKNKGMYFDADEYKEWGYEDIAFGIDALFYGVEMEMTTTCNTYHFLHDRSDGLYTHVLGKSKIFQRYIKLTEMKMRGQL